jgi:uncharacterized membrane protein
MARRANWKGIATGALAGAGAATALLLFPNLWGRAGRSRIIRLEKTLQIGRPVEEVFQAWQRLEDLPEMADSVIGIRREGSRSFWRVRVDGRELAWTAEIEQFVPNQAIGWKTVSGPKHTGRINFPPLGNDTVLHVTMNYVPRTPLFRPFLAPMSGNMEGYIEAVLRDFKRALESRVTATAAHAQTGPAAFAGSTGEPLRATGTLGAPPEAKR